MHSIDPHALEVAKRETLARLAHTREALVTQLHAAAWSVQAAAHHAAEGRLAAARDELTRAGELLLGVVETDAHLAPLRAVIGGAP